MSDGQESGTYLWMRDIVRYVDIDDTEALTHGPVNVLRHSVSLDERLAISEKTVAFRGALPSRYCEHPDYCPKDQAALQARALGGERNYVSTRIKERFHTKAVLTDRG